MVCRLFGSIQGRALLGGDAFRFEVHRLSMLNANASVISSTPAHGSALLAHTGSGLADTVNHYPARATAHADLRDHVVRLSKRRWRHCLCRCCDGKSKASSGNQLDHSFPLFFDEHQEKY